MSIALEQTLERPSIVALPLARDLKLDVGLATVVVFFGFHAVLAVAMSNVRAISTVHALLVLLVGLCVAVSNCPLEKVAYVGAYIAGSEVLWRMTGAQVFWEFGKYATILIFMLAIVRRGKTNGPALMLVYFVLLLPSTALTFVEEDFLTAKDMVSFNMSGPIALLVSAWLFSQLKLSTTQLKKLILIPVGPIVGIAAITVFNLSTNVDLRFGGSSNFDLTGGFGPNQVAAVMGLGALIAFLFCLDEAVNLKLRMVLLVVMLILIVQSALTFSRGGVYMAAISAAGAGIYLLRDKRSGAKLIIIAGVVFTLSLFLIIPNLDSLTGGAFLTRFQNTETSGRFEIAAMELMLWFENPLLGVGPGRGINVIGFASHTEFSRLLGEHGMFGLISLFILLLAVGGEFKRRRPPSAKIILTAMLVWSFLFLGINAMRLVAPLFALCLLFATVRPNYQLWKIRLNNAPSIPDIKISRRRRIRRPRLNK